MLKNFPASSTEIENIFCKIDLLLNSNRNNIIVAIDGKSASGKTTLAKLISDRYDANVFHMDDFFLTPSMRTAERLSTPGENVDHERFYEEVINGIQSNKPFSYRVYDCSICDFSKEIFVTPEKLNIIEGSYSMHPTLQGFYDLKIFTDIDYETQKLRILERNGAESLEKFTNLWIPLENKYFDAFDIKSLSDIVL